MITLALRIVCVAAGISASTARVAVRLGGHTPSVVADGAAAIAGLTAAPATVIAQFDADAIGGAAAQLDLVPHLVRLGFVPPHAWVVYVVQPGAFANLSLTRGIARIFAYEPHHKCPLLEARHRALRIADGAALAAVDVGVVPGSVATVATAVAAGLAATAARDSGACFDTPRTCVGSVHVTAAHVGTTVTKLRVPSANTSSVSSSCAATLSLITAGISVLHVRIDAAATGGPCAIAASPPRLADDVLRAIAALPDVVTITEHVPPTARNAFARGTTQASDAASWVLSGGLTQEFGSCTTGTSCIPDWTTVTWRDPPIGTCTLGCSSPACGFDYRACYNPTAESPITRAGLTGAGQLVQVIDSGLDYLHAFFADGSAPVVPWKPNGGVAPLSPGRKVAAYVAYMDAIDAPCGHGTHVAGSVAGTPLPGSTDYAVTLPFSGMATGARLIFTDVECDTPGGCACPPSLPCPCANQVCPAGGGFITSVNIGSTFGFGYDAGGRISSNSWGGGPGTYSQECADIDTYVAAHDDLLVLFAASNDGAVTGQEGPTIAYASLDGEAVAKNVLTVGAATRDFPARAALQGSWSGLFSLIQGPESDMSCDVFPLLVNNKPPPCSAGLNAILSWAYSCSSPPAAIDCRASFDWALCCGFTLTAVAAAMVPPSQQPQELMELALNYDSRFRATFSSVGPTFDGRTKPDVIAPGHLIISARAGSNPATCANPGYTPGSRGSRLLVGKSGTSMATPITAGNAALVRQYFTYGYYPTGAIAMGSGFTPSAALLKAVLINSASVADYNLINILSGGTVYTLDSIRDQTGYGQVMLIRGLSFASLGSGAAAVTRAAGALPTLLLPGLSVTPVAAGETDPPPAPGRRGRDPVVGHGATLDWCVGWVPAGWGSVEGTGDSSGTRVGATVVRPLGRAPQSR